MKPSPSTAAVVLWALAALFVVYATTIPFNFVTDSATVADHIARVRINPIISPETGRRISGPDFVLNVFFFVPFGALGFISLRRPRSIPWRIATVVLCAAAFSIVVETLQLFTADRVTSAADVFANSVGAFIGASGWALFGGGTKAFVAEMAAAGLADAPAFYPMMVASLMLCIAAWEPFDASLDVGSTVGKLRTFVRDPWQFTVVADEGVAFLRYMLFTVITATWVRQLRWRAVGLVALAAGTVAGLGLEASQLFIDARMPGLEDALVNVAGAAAGVIVFLRLPRHPRPALTWTALAALTAIAAAIQQLSPFAAAPEYRPFQWVPFLNYYLFTTTATVSHSIELLMLYFPLGFGLQLIVRRRWHVDVLAIVVVLAIAGPLEYLQRWIGDRYPDITDVALSAVGGWLGVWVAREGWRRFHAYRWELTADRRPFSTARAIP